MKPGTRTAAIALRPGTAVALIALVLFGLLCGSPAHATAPAIIPCPESFDSEPVAMLVEQIKTVGEATWGAGGDAADCASKALASKGKEVVPVLLSLMETHQNGAEYYSLRAICDLGPAGADAVPYIMGRLRAGNDKDLTEDMYNALVCIGEAARPAIPLLFDESQSTDFESEAAIRTLGRLAPYEPDTIIPDLIQLLDQPAHIVDAARALEYDEMIAKRASEPLRRHLLLAVRAGQDETAADLIRALEALEETGPALAPLVEMLKQRGVSNAAAKALRRIGPEAELAIPLLVARANAPHTSPQERDDDIAAIIAIAQELSPAVLRAIIVYIARNENWPRDYSVASWLTQVNPFPKALAPALVTAIARFPQDDRIRGRLEETLEHTRQPAKPAAAASSSPVDVSRDLGPGLLRLTRQSGAVSLRDVAAELHLSLSDYVDQDVGGQTAPATKRDWARSTTGASPVFWIRVEKVQQSLDVSDRDSPLPVRQKIEIRLAHGACVAMDAIRARELARDRSLPGLPTVSVFASHNPTQAAVLPVVQDNLTDHGKAHESSLQVGPGCAEDILIEKWFDAGYWNSACPFSADHRYVQAVIIPAVRKLLGSELATYAVDSPQVYDFGKSVQVGLDSVRPGDPPPDWQPNRVWLNIDRCSHEASIISKYTPSATSRP
jgi:hypothetical protein